VATGRSANAGSTCGCRATATTYFITSENDVVEFDIGLEETGRKLGCLNPWETLVTG